MSNPYEEAARFRKAQRLADTLCANKFSSDEVSAWPHQVWLSAGALAGVKHAASEKTIALTVKIMRDRENALIAAAIVREEMVEAAL